MKDKENYLLNWQGPFSLMGHNNIWDIKETQGGIYVFCWLVRNEYYAHYIGMTQKNFIERITQHIQLFMSGKYYIYDTKALNTERMQYIFAPKDKLIKFIKDYQNITKELQIYFKRLAIFIAPLDLDKNSLLIIEAKLSQIIIDKQLNAILDSPNPKKSLLNNDVEIVSSGSIIPKGFLCQPSCNTVI